MALLPRMRDLLQRTLGSSISIEIAEPPGPLFALGDEVQLEMAILNLAINARDAMPEGGVLTIRAARAEKSGAGGLEAGSYVDLSITDSGLGMAPETVGHSIPSSRPSLWARAPVLG